ncbi:MAG: hypothetical protein K5650_01485 [Bacteroidales bacterium]|nr:hypothetical protein [Bacteroidales bacterium]
MAADIAIKGPADIEVIKHRIHKVQGLNLKSQIVTSNPGISNTESNTHFAVKNFDRKIMEKTEQDAKMAA